MLAGQWFTEKEFPEEDTQGRMIMEVQPDGSSKQVGGIGDEFDYEVTEGEAYIKMHNESIRRLLDHQEK